MNFYVRGDCHGDFDWIDNIKDSVPVGSGIIILGDAGINFYLNKIDKKLKEKINESGYIFYLVRGNHEARPSSIGMKRYFDKNVGNGVYMELEYPNIKYFEDGAVYYINKYKVLVIGGAYSIDKEIRLARRSRIDGWCGWFEDEQLSQIERETISNFTKNKTFDFILTHTCPISYQPIDLFLDHIDQSKVDNTMELWLEEIKDNCNWNIWLFGHYHVDRIERPHVEMVYNNIENLEDIYKRWSDGEIPWYLPTGPSYYMK